PPNAGGCDGRYFPSIVVVALGEPGVPVICCARAVAAVSGNSTSAASMLRACGSFIMLGLLPIAAIEGSLRRPPSAIPIAHRSGARRRGCTMALRNLVPLAIRPVLSIGTVARRGATPEVMQFVNARFGQT